MAEFTVVLVEPKNDGNIGAVCRAMKNFGLRDLIIVNHPELSDDAYKRAMHSTDILDNAIHAKTIKSALKNIDFIAATSGKTSSSMTNYLRKSLTPRRFAEMMRDSDCRAGILFGREDYGLFSSELEQCDVVIQIPNSHEYHSMNLSHAAAVIFYEIFISENEQALGASGRRLRKLEKDKLFEYFNRVVDNVDYPPFKREKAKIMFRRLISRAVPDEYEFSILMGVFNKTLRKVERIPGRYTETNCRTRKDDKTRTRKKKQ